MQDNIKKLLKNSLIAQALGDAFGYIIEFKDWNIIKKIYGDQGLQYEPEKLHLIVSDDTQMTLFCLNGVNQAKINDNLNGQKLEDPTEEIYKNYLDWHKTQTTNYVEKDFSYGIKHFSLLKYKDLFAKRAPGNTCLSALGSGRKGTIKNLINDSKGCGGIMRTLPLAFYANSTKEAFSWGAKQAALTHGHPSGYLSAGLYSAICYELIYNTRDIFEAISIAEPILQEYEGHEEMLSVLNKTVWVIKNNEGLVADSLTQELGGGWVGEEAFAVAAYCAATSLTFKEVLEKASNHSGDSDSTAMLAAGLWYLITRDESFVGDFKYLDIRESFIGLIETIR